MKGTLRLVSFALIVVVLGAGPQVSFAQAAGPAIPAGLLPDVVGLRPGIAAHEALDFLKGYDRIARVYISDTPMPELGGGKPVPYAIAMAEDESNAAETIQADLTWPPESQVVWRVARLLRFAPDKQTTPEKLIATLREKYGTESVGVKQRAPRLSWYFDERGQRAALPGGMHPASCMGYYGPTSTLSGVPAQHGGGQYLLAQAAATSKQDATCQSLVLVHALTEASLDGLLITSLTIIVADLPLEARTHQRTTEFLAKDNAARLRQELDRANQQAKPKL